MRHYEIVLLFHPEQSDAVPKMVDDYKKIVTTASGQVHRSEDWGRRVLAYKINDLQNAHYIMLNVECELKQLRELEDKFKFNDAIIRTLVIRRANAISEDSVILKAKAKEDKEAEEDKAAKKKLAAAMKSGADKPIDMTGIANKGAPQTTDNEEAK